MSRQHLFLLFAILSLLSACRGEDGRSASIKLKGSDTGLPISQKLADEYMQRDASYSITVNGGGSGVGISSLLDGSTDIAISSRALKLDEKLRLIERKQDIQTLIVAYDALAIVVHKNNPLKGVTRQQVEDIYTGKVTTWKEIGGADLKIIAYARESSSGTFEFFKEHVLGNWNYSSSVLNMPATGAIVQSVGQTEGAIGYVGLAYLDKALKVLPIAYEENVFVRPSLETAKDGSYPVARPLYYFYPKAVEPKIKNFLEFCLSPEGQAGVASTGYIPAR